MQSMTALPTGRPLALPDIQTNFPAEQVAENQVRLQRQAAVKATFSRCWDSYKKFAWKSDEVAPISGGARNTFGGWGATLVDSLDTLFIMDMRDEFQHAVAAAVNISFETTTMSDINVFETNIRYLGGFLSAYDLSRDARLLRKAKEVGDMLYAAFDTPNRMPITRWNPNDAAAGGQVAHDNVLLAEMGSFTMEFSRLSLLTGDPKWFDAANRITQTFQEQQGSTLLPGLWPIVVNAKDKRFNQHNDFTLGAMADSTFEYLPKTYALLGGLAPEYKTMYKYAMETAMKHTLFRPLVPDDRDILLSTLAKVRSNDGTSELEAQGQHLVCYAGGMLALGARLFNEPLHLEAAEKLVNGCIWTYQAMPIGIMPESFHMLPCQISSSGSCTWDEGRWKDAILERHGRDPDVVITEKHLPPGFTDIGDTRYILRPEAIESVFVLYRTTGRADLPDIGWRMFEAIENSTRTALANSALSDITVVPPERSDSMESFWMGETLKYFYLLFSDPGLVSLDEFVFNTEAHPLRRLLP